MSGTQAIATREASGLEQNGNSNTSIMAGAEMRLEDFQARIEHEEKMRVVLRDYVKRNMKEGHHFSNSIGTQQLAKPMLLQEGTRNICSLFKLTFGQPQIQETFLEGDHYRVRVHIDLYNAQGLQIASGDAVCSTRETKYAYRKGERICPKCDTAAIRKDNKKDAGGWYCWSKLDGCGAQFPANEPSITEQQIGRVDNQDKADIENTVLKMGVKRAKSAAVCDVPLVSEIFAPEGEGNSDKPQRSTNGSTKKVERTPSAAPAPQTESVVENVVGIAKKLEGHGIETNLLVDQFLPEGVAAFADLTDAQALEIRPAMVELLNSKIAEKK